MQDQVSSMSTDSVESQVSEVSLLYSLLYECDLQFLSSVLCAASTADTEFDTENGRNCRHSRVQLCTSKVLLTHY